MCPPEVTASFCNGEVSRRSLFKFGLGAAAALAAIPAAKVGAATVRPTTFRNVMDLTHVLGPGTPVFLGAPSFKIDEAANHKRDGYYGSILTYWEHVGTHMDAPVHFSANGMYVDQIPAEMLVVPVAVIDISARAARDPDTVVTPDDIMAWERRYGRLPENAAVLMNSGWATRIGSTQTYRNTDSSNVMHFPGFGKAAVDMLLAERRVVGIGVDTLSLDHGPSKDFAVHYTFLPTNRWGLENLANLDSIPPSGATLFVGAPRVAAGSGGPSRVMAVW